MRRLKVDFFYFYEVCICIYAQGLAVCRRPGGLLHSSGPRGGGLCAAVRFSVHQRQRQPRRAQRQPTPASFVGSASGSSWCARRKGRPANAAPTSAPTACGRGAVRACDAGCGVGCAVGSGTASGSATLPGAPPGRVSGTIGSIECAVCAILFKCFGVGARAGDAERRDNTHFSDGVAQTRKTASHTKNVITVR